MQIIPFGLRIKKIPTIKPIWEDFSNQWNSVLHDSEKLLVQLVLAETQKVVEKTQFEFNKELHEKYPESFREEKLLTEKRNGNIKTQLETKRVRKWINISVILILEGSLYILYLVTEKKETKHRKISCFL